MVQKIATTLFALALVTCTPTQSDEPEIREQYFLQSTESFHVLCMDEDTRERIRSIMIKALDEALQTQVETLFLTWLKDSAGQPARARQGVRNAIEAYLDARKGALRWSPMQC